MIIVCPNCNTRFEINERQVPTGSRKMRCAFCQHVFYKEITLPEGVESELKNLEDNPELLGTMLLNLWNKPKKREEPNKNRPLSDQNRALPRISAPIEVMAVPEGEGTASSTTPVARGLCRMMLTDIQKAGMLFKSRWIVSMEWSDIKLLAPYWEVFKAPEGVALFREGDHNPFLCLIFVGEVRLTGPGAELKSGIKNPLLKPGNSFGELVLFSNKPRTSNAIAEKESYCLVLTRKRFREMSERDPLLWQGVMRVLSTMMSQNIQEAHGHLPDFLVAP